MIPIGSFLFCFEEEADKNELYFVFLSDEHHHPTLL